MSVDLVVIGAGIAGSSVVRAARARGLRTLLVADGPGASAAAVGLICLDWLRPGRQRTRAERSLALYRAEGLLLPAPTQLAGWRAPTPVPAPLAQAVRVAAALLPPDLRCRLASPAEAVRRFAPRCGVVVCAGAESPALGGPAQRFTHGATLVGDCAEAPSCRIYRLAPYQTLARCADGAELRLGSSSTPQAARALPALLGHLARPLPADFTVPAGLSVRAGVRGTLADAPPRVPHGYAALAYAYEPRWNARRTLCHFAGLGKLGYALAPAVAAEIVAEFGAQ